jgi:hypothetical protein
MIADKLPPGYFVPCPTCGAGTIYTSWDRVTYLIQSVALSDDFDQQFTVMGFVCSRHHHFSRTTLNRRAGCEDVYQPIPCPDPETCPLAGQGIESLQG